MKALKVTLVILVLILIAEVGFLLHTDIGKELLANHPTTEATEAPTTEMPTESISIELPPAVTMEPTEEPTTEATTVPTEAPTEEVMEVPTEAPTEAPTEPQPETFLLTFAGSCTLGSTPADANNEVGYLRTVGDNYSHPFAKVQDYFGNDEFTLVNLEGVLADGGTPENKEYAFIGPSAYAAILSQGSVDAVSLANDHTSDFGSAGYTDTKNALSNEGVSYIENRSTLLFTTDNGIKVGVYAVNGILNQADMKKDFAQLKQDGADIIVACFHWGIVNKTTPTKIQISYGRTAIDLGADIVIGTGPHSIQPIECYKNRYICYSLGNFSYGGTKWLTNLDTVLVQLEVVRDIDQTIIIGELRIIPCNMTSSGGSLNNYQPMPLDTNNWQYFQIINKLSKDVNSTTNTNSNTTEATQTTEPATNATEAPTDATTVPTIEAPTDAPTTEVPTTEAPSHSTESSNTDVPNTDATQQ